MKNPIATGTCRHVVALAFAGILASGCRADARPPTPTAEPPTAVATAAVAPAPSAPAGAGASITEELKVSIGEASAVAALGDGRFLVVDDELGVRLVERGVARMFLSAADHPELGELEGICVVGDQVVVVSERSGAVTSFAVPRPGAAASAKPVARGALAHPPFEGKTKKNKGWEGLAFLPAALAADKKDHLIAVHEGAPKAVAMFSWPSLTAEKTYVLSGQLDALLGDLSDVAVDPKSGELLLLSDKSRQVARVSAGADLTLVASYGVPVADKEKPEGISFDEVGRIWIVTDATGRLFRIASDVRP